MLRVRTSISGRVFAVALTAAVAALLSGCPDCPPGSEDCPCKEDRVCDEGLACEEDVCRACPVGELDCACFEDDTCLEGRECNLGRCIESGCPRGTEGCPCADGERCGVNSLGEELVCDASTCVAPSCAPGATGCACLGGSDCGNAADECRDGYCQPRGCIPGELNCTCLAGTCLPGLSCREDEICVDATGFLGGPCYQDDTCNRGYRCDLGSCVQCMLGGSGCSCDDIGGCDMGLHCIEDHCAVSGSVVAPPDAPRCYTPCESDLVLADGTFRSCPADGLMEGCLTQFECVEGSCTDPGGEPLTCTEDLDCPSFQACLQGQCYSNCENDTECPEGMACDQHVCRVMCQVSGSECGEGLTCVTGDGEFGYCEAMATPGDEEQLSVDGSFALDASIVEFSNVKTSVEITITNGNPADQRFVIRKRSHSATMSDGSSEFYDDPADDGVDCDPATDCPLFWLELGEPGLTARTQSFELNVPGGGGSATFAVEGAGDSAAPRWTGHLEVIHHNMGAQTLVLDYAERPEGRWTGEIYYFANFEPAGIDAWAASPATRVDDQLLLAVNNAFIQRWGIFRTGNLSWDEFLAVLAATKSGSWAWPSVMEDCQESPDGACYMYSTGTGLETYSTSLESKPIPSGLVELPMAANLFFPDPGDLSVMQGRIDSAHSMQYAGDPAITVRFGHDPSTCDVDQGGSCLVFIDDLQADIFVGGRYAPPLDALDCTARPNYEMVDLPWLIPGFTHNTTLDGGLRYRHECRDTQLPFGEAGNVSTDLVPLNKSLAASNPIPDGRTRRRSIRLIDGALINQNQMFIIFKETYESFLPGDTGTFDAYGYMILEKKVADLDQADDDLDGVPNVFEGSTPVDERPESVDLLNVSCPADLVMSLLSDLETQVTPGNADDLVHAVIDGLSPTFAADTIDPLDPLEQEEVHYLCVDNGLFDGGKDNLTTGSTPAPNDDFCIWDDAATNPYDDDGRCDDGGENSERSICPIGTDFTDCGSRDAAQGDARVECPHGSEVIFFTVDRDVKSQADIAELDCQETGTCDVTLSEWEGTNHIVQYKPYWQCSGGNDQVYCSEDRHDLRQGKVFYNAPDIPTQMAPLYPAIEQAFRYRTKFRSRTGAMVGFAPQICIPGSNQIPYCYDPPEIETARARVDCLLYLWDKHYDDLAEDPEGGRSQSTKERVNTFLCRNYSYTEACPAGQPQGEVHDGFERLYAELLVMMGDESYTKAFASRFDLAGSNTVSFEGTAFEGEDGINLSGAAGFEMYSLYQAAQYYQEALDRFYGMSPLLWRSLGHYQEGARNFVTPETVTRYFERLIRASTQKARTWSQVAIRYQNFNRPGLARRVIERAYTATYIESVALARMMNDIMGTLSRQDLPAVEQVLLEGQRRYRMAMLDMRNVYSTITDNISYFGFPPDYIPFPTLSNQIDMSAFEVILNRAKNKVQIALQRENDALQRNRAYETDAAEFQAELVRLRNTYENQLGDVCGTFPGSTDGRIYPAIARYAPEHEMLMQFQNPCGLVNNGQIFTTMAQIEMSRVDLERILQSKANLLQEVDLEMRTASQQCSRVLTLADYVFTQRNEISNLQLVVQGLNWGVRRAERAIQVTQSIAEIIRCIVIAGPGGGGGNCQFVPAATGMVLGAQLLGEGIIAGLEAGVIATERSISDIENKTGYWQSVTECESTLIQSNANTERLMMRMKELELEALRADYQVQLQLSELQRLYNQAQRLEQELQEAEQHSINIQAARNDPNVRIYRNDAYLNADITFDDALREAYRATKVFEYYTSQSYAALEKLFLIRMVQYGDYNLANYLAELENEFFVFEEEYGLPDTRVAILSLRDDILRVARLDENSIAIPQGTRIDMMREELRDPNYLDRHGYLTIPFSTNFERLSPLTRNHKVLYLETEIIGSEVGDTIGRIYLRQQGTSTVHSVSGDKLYYRFPERLAVINPFFNGTRFFTPEVYRNNRMRDRPYVNTSWELVINQRDEYENQDINLQALNDVRVFVYYTDFTEF